MQAQLEATRASLQNSIFLQRHDVTIDDRNADPLDQVVADSAREEAGRNIQRSRDMLVEIDGALDRIKNGDYGDCIDCDNPIPEKRLLARPAAKRCLFCQDQYEKQERSRVN